MSTTHLAIWLQNLLEAIFRPPF